MQETRWSDPQLARDREDLEKHTAILAELEAEWSRLENRTDYGADQRRQQLRDVLPAQFARRDARTRRIEAGEERERIINELLFLHTQYSGYVQRSLEQLTERTEVPDEDTFVAFYCLNRQVEQLRIALFTATGLSDLAREWDAVLVLKSFWFDQNRDRERLFTRTLAPGHRPKVDPAPWAASVARLRELRPIKEEVHAAVR